MNVHIIAVHFVWGYGVFVKTPTELFFRGFMKKLYLLLLLSSLVLTGQKQLNAAEKVSPFGNQLVLAREDKAASLATPDSGGIMAGLRAMAISPSSFVSRIRGFMPSSLSENSLSSLRAGNNDSPATTEESSGKSTPIPIETFELVVEKLVVENEDDGDDDEYDDEYRSFSYLHGAYVAPRAEEKLNEFFRLDQEGRTGLHWIANQKNSLPEISVMIQLAKNFGKDISSLVNIQDANGKTALHYAAKHPRWKVIEELMNAGAYVDVFDNQGVTAKQLIAEKLLTMQNLVRSDSKLSDFKKAIVIAQRLEISVATIVNMQDHTGKTLLHYAAEHGCSKIVYELIYATQCTGSYVATMDIRDSQGKTPLHYAREFGHSEVTKKLVNAHCDQSILDNGGLRPVDYARQFAGKK